MKRQPFDSSTMIQKVQDILATMKEGNTFTLRIHYRTQPKPTVWFIYTRRDPMGNLVQREEDMSDWLEPTPYVLRKSDSAFKGDEKVGPNTWEDFFKDPNGRIETIRSHVSAAGMNFKLEEIY